ncbi:MAG: class I SAM-dependent methyltransferase [Acidimicrobiales bacterium]
MRAVPVTRRLRDSLKSVPPLYRALRWARMTIGQALPPRQLAGVRGRIHANDLMIPRRVAEHVSGYVGSGQQIATLVGEHLGEVAPKGSSLAGLDLGCGYGRVLRHLVVDLPSVHWTAADVDRSAVRFCRREFGVAGVVCSGVMNETRFPEAPFDVVWMGSLLTHLPPAAAQDMWALLRANMHSGGLLALSTHGPACLDHIEDLVPNGSKQAGRLSSDLAVSGVAYVRYPHYRRIEYGLAFHTTEAVASQVRHVFGPGTELLTVQPRGWLEMQDLYVFRTGELQRQPQPST